MAQIFFSTHSNLNDEDDGEEASDNEEVEIRSVLEESQPKDYAEDVMSPQEDASIMSPSSCQSQPKTPASIASSSISRKTKSTSRNAETFTEILREYVDEKKRSRLQRSTTIPRPDDSVLDFFINMGKTATTFPPLWQASIKKHVFEIVNSYELQLLAGTSQALTLTQNQSGIHNPPPNHTSRPYPNQQYPNVSGMSASTYYSQFGPHLPSTQTNEQNIPQYNNVPSTSTCQSLSVTESQEVLPQQSLPFYPHSDEN